jgi:hypothetical protein
VKWLLICIAAVMTSQSVAAENDLGPGDCPFAAGEKVHVGEHRNRWAMRAIAIVQHAGQPGWQTDEVLRKWIAPDAQFSLGAGDVGRPLSSGSTGAHELAQMMKAEEFRYSLHTGLPFAVAEPCKEGKVDVQFIVPNERAEFDLTFHFADGRLVSAKGWSGYFNSGLIQSKIGVGGDE